MLEIILVGSAATALFRLAKNNGLTGWIWSVLTIVGYLGGAFLAGIILFIVAPEMLNDRLILGLLGIVAGGLGILIVYLLLKAQINKKKNEISESDVLDSDI